MSKVSVLDTQKRVLEPCHPAVARRLLREGKAAVFKRYPFTIILKREVADPKTTDYTLSIDPGSRCTGMAITDSGNNIVACFELHHRGQAIKKRLSDKAGYRRSRRTRKLRHRKARWNNRSRKAPVLTPDGWQYKSLGQSSKDWVAPSLMSRVFNIHTWVSRLSKIYPITLLAVEHVKQRLRSYGHISLKVCQLRVLLISFQTGLQMLSGKSTICFAKMKSLWSDRKDGERQSLSKNR